MPRAEKHNIAVPPFRPVSRKMRDALRSRISSRPGVLVAPTAKEIAQMKREMYAEPIEFVRNEAHAIEKWPDYKFSTEDGRTFGLFLWGDSILKRLEAASISVNRRDREGVKRVHKLAGFIMEIGTDHPPLIFDNIDCLYRAWAETHAAYGIEPTEEEFNELNLPDFWAEGDEEDEVSN